MSTTTHPSAMREAWAIIARGFEDALSVPGIEAGERDRIIRCVTKARRLAGQRHLAVAESGVIFQFPKVK